MDWFTAAGVHARNGLAGLGQWRDDVCEREPVGYQYDPIFPPPRGSGGGGGEPVGYQYDPVFSPPRRGMPDRDPITGDPIGYAHDQIFPLPPALAGRLGQFEDDFSAERWLPPDYVAPAEELVMYPYDPVWPLLPDMPLPPMDMSSLPPAPDPVTIETAVNGSGPSPAQVQNAILEAIRTGRDVSTAVSDIYRTVSALGEPGGVVTTVPHAAAVAGGGLPQSMWLWGGLGLLALAALRRRG